MRSFYPSRRKPAGVKGRFSHHGAQTMLNRLKRGRVTPMRAKRGPLPVNG